LKSGVNTNDSQAVASAEAGLPGRASVEWAITQPSYLQSEVTPESRRRGVSPFPHWGNWRKGEKEKGRRGADCAIVRRGANAPYGPTANSATSYSWPAVFFSHISMSWRLLRTISLGPSGTLSIWVDARDVSSPVSFGFGGQMGSFVCGVAAWSRGRRVEVGSAASVTTLRFLSPQGRSSRGILKPLRLWFRAMRYVIE